VPIISYRGSCICASLDPVCYQSLENLRIFIYFRDCISPVNENDYIPKFRRRNSVTKYPKPVKNSKAPRVRGAFEFSARRKRHEAGFNFVFFFKTKPKTAPCLLLQAEKSKAPSTRGAFKFSARRRRREQVSILKSKPASTFF